jgi:hypothetical protein
VHDAAFHTSRFVDDPLEESADRIRPERALYGHVPDVIDDLFFAIGLINGYALCLLQAANLARHARALIQQADDHLVHTIDVSPQFVKRGH